MPIHQLIYRLERAEAFPAAAPEGVRLWVLAGVRGIGSRAALLLRRFGPLGLIRQAVKLVLAGRYYACAVRGGRIVSDCHLTVSRCRHYPVEAGAVVLGPVWTAEEERGKGLATAVVQAAMNAMIARGHTIFYIDTSEKNIAMQKAIARCGFGPPVQSIMKKAPIR